MNRPPRRPPPAPIPPPTLAETAATRTLDLVDQLEASTDQLERAIAERR